MERSNDGLHDYFSLRYPYKLVERLLRQWAPDQCELMVKVDSGPPVRNQPLRNFYSLVSSSHPVDGLHCAAGHAPSSAFVIDLDHDGPRQILCQCGDRLICNRCWIAMCGTLRAYVYVLRRQFGCHHLLCSFSGGRGCHILALAPPPTMNRIAAHEFLRDALPSSLISLAESYLTISAQHQDKAIPLTMFNPHERISRLLVSSIADQNKLCAAYIEPFFVDLFKTIVYPFFCDEWRPRVIGPKATVVDAIRCAGALLAAPHRVSDEHQCASCVLILAHEHAHTMHRQHLAATGAGFEPWDRVDVFLSVMTLFWTRPDANLAEPSHMLRVPFSPHGRSGNISLPIDPLRAHELYPATYPPSMAGGSHTMFEHAVELTSDLLSQLERRPSVGVRPA